jgi:Xaa-Pro aminopeptidase
MDGSESNLDLRSQRRARVLASLQRANFDWLIVALQENAGYICGYRSMSETMKRDPTLAVALHASGETFVIAPAADAGPLLHDAFVDSEHLIPYGRFYFESVDNGPVSNVSGVHADFAEAAEALLLRLGTVNRFAFDSPAARLFGARAQELGDVDGSQWMLSVRSVKLPDEVERLENAARITEAAISDSVRNARIGVTEQHLARSIARQIAENGGTPKFIVVTSGERSALSDAYATNRAIESGDIIRFDIGCVVDEYWADLGRTAVLGAPTAEQTRIYAALLAGEQAQLDAARPGTRAVDLFNIAVDIVRKVGIPTYRRHHCGHAIGTEVYEAPIIAPGWPELLQPGMTFCFETPYYLTGWGGMMVEDMVVITDGGCRMLSHSDRSLRIICPETG